MRSEVTFDDVAEFVTSLPDVTVTTSYGNRTWTVGNKIFAWHRPFTKADIKRFGDETPPAGEILAVKVENLDAKDALLSIAPPGFFTIQHFDGFPAVLIELAKARVKDVRGVLRDAHQHAAASAKAKKPKPKAKKRKRR